jgi:RNA polymerase sigma-70 factor, ECF subfamily
VCQMDEQCIRDCLDGHPEAFRQLVSRHQGALMGYLRGRIGNEEEVAEAAQETFVRAYFALRNLHKLGSFFSWLVGIADRVARETWRDQKRRQCVEFDERQTPQSHVDSSDSPDHHVTEAVGRLPDAYREVVLLRFYGGLSCAEIGRNLELPIGTVTKRLSRAYTLLRECLSSENSKATLKVVLPENSETTSKVDLLENSKTTLKVVLREENPQTDSEMKS